MKDLRLFQGSGGCAAGKSTITKYKTSLDEVTKVARSTHVSLNLLAINANDGSPWDTSKGFSASEMLSFAMTAGKNPCVSSFDLSELCFIGDGKKSFRFIADLFYYFLLGFSTRPKSTQRP